MLVTGIICFIAGAIATFLVVLWDTWRRAAAGTVARDTTLNCYRGLLRREEQHTVRLTNLLCRRDKVLLALQPVLAHRRQVLGDLHTAWLGHGWREVRRILEEEFRPRETFLARGEEGGEALLLPPAEEESASPPTPAAAGPRWSAYDRARQPDSDMTNVYVPAPLEEGARPSSLSFYAANGSLIGRFEEESS